jgi:hypothetical protein
MLFSPSATYMGRFYAAGEQDNQHHTLVSFWYKPRQMNLDLGQFC